MKKKNNIFEIKKGQQISISITNNKYSKNLLDGLKLECIDIRKDWSNILKTIKKYQHIQRAMEKAYQDFQEGHKLKDFKYRNGINGAWSFSNIDNGQYPYTLTTTNWLFEFERNEWEIQAKKQEITAMKSLDNAIDKCRRLPGFSDVLDRLEDSQTKLLSKYPPRESQPETWRPQKSSIWSSKWIKILAETHYKSLLCEWKIISSENHSIVAGIIPNKKAYLIDILLLTTDTNTIISLL